MKRRYKPFSAVKNQRLSGFSKSEPFSVEQLKSLESVVDKMLLADNVSEEAYTDIVKDLNSPIQDDLVPDMEIVLEVAKRRSDFFKTHNRFDYESLSNDISIYLNRVWDFLSGRQITIDVYDREVIGKLVQEFFQGDEKAFYAFSIDPQVANDPNNDVSEQEGDDQEDDVSEQEGGGQEDEEYPELITLNLFDENGNVFKSLDVGGLLFEVESIDGQTKDAAYIQGPRSEYGNLTDEVIYPAYVVYGNGDVLGGVAVDTSTKEIVVIDDSGEVSAVRNFDFGQFAPGLDKEKAFAYWYDPNETEPLTWSSRSGYTYPRQMGGYLLTANDLLVEALNSIAGPEGPFVETDSPIYKLVHATRAALIDVNTLDNLAAEQRFEKVTDYTLAAPTAVLLFNVLGFPYYDKDDFFEIYGLLVDDSVVFNQQAAVQDYIDLLIGDVCTSREASPTFDAVRIVEEYLGSTVISEGLFGICDAAELSDVNLDNFAEYVSNNNVEAFIRFRNAAMDELGDMEAAAIISQAKEEITNQERVINAETPISQDLSRSTEDVLSKAEPVVVNKAGAILGVAAAGALLWTLFKKSK